MKDQGKGGQTALVIAGFIVILTYVLMIDLKGVSTDEGIRLAIMNGGKTYLLNVPPNGMRWAEVLEANQPYAYQPLYFLIQNTLMGVAQTQNVVFLRLVNVIFLWVALQGLLALAKDWALAPRLFLIGVFSFNAYLFMHVLQIREYILGVVFYVWSTWLVLRLAAGKLERSWRDIAWFAAYGGLLTLGFYVQTWVVFPAIGQGLFLLWRRKGDRGRFYAHLALSYLIVITTTLPYLRANAQKVDVGRWGWAGSSLGTQLSDGFHLVLAGHPGGHSWFTDFLFWFWLALIAGAALVLFRRKSGAPAGVPPGEVTRQGALMILCLAVPLAFQVYYFYRMDNLSVWPRYFVIHYFFLTWLVALAVRYLHALGAAPEIAAAPRRRYRTAVGAAWLVLLASVVYQTRSYYQDPFLDTGLTPDCDWRNLATGMSRVVKPSDVVLVHEFINRSTLTFTRPVSNRVLMLSELDAAGLKSADRLVYLESSASIPHRADLAARMAALGFSAMEEFRLPTANGQAFISEWRLLAFSRR